MNVFVLSQMNLHTLSSDDDDNNDDHDDDDNIMSLANSAIDSYTTKVHLVKAYVRQCYKCG